MGFAVCPLLVRPAFHTHLPKQSTIISQACGRLLLLKCIPAHQRGITGRPSPPATVCRLCSVSAHVTKQTSTQDPFPRQLLAMEFPKYCPWRGRGAAHPPGHWCEQTTLWGSRFPGQRPLVPSCPTCVSKVASANPKHSDGFPFPSVPGPQGPRSQLLDPLGDRPHHSGWEAQWQGVSCTASCVLGKVGKGTGVCSGQVRHTDVEASHPKGEVC